MNELGPGSRAQDDERDFGESGSDEMNNRREDTHTSGNGQSKARRGHTFPADEDISSSEGSENEHPEIPMEGSRVVAGNGAASRQMPKRTKSHQAGRTSGGRKKTGSPGRSNKSKASTRNSSASQTGRTAKARSNPGPAVRGGTSSRQKVGRSAGNKIVKAQSGRMGNARAAKLGVSGNTRTSTARRAGAVKAGRR